MFTLVITDFGIAKVIGGKFNVLATDVYKQVIGQQNFEMGAVVGIVLLVPAVLAFVVDRLRPAPAGGAAVGARRAARCPSRKLGRDVFFTAFCTVVVGRHPRHPRHGGVGLAGHVLALQSRLTLENYDFANFDANGWASYFNSLRDGGRGRGLRHRRWCSSAPS